MGFEVRPIDKKSEIMWQVRDLYDLAFQDTREFTEFFFSNVVVRRDTEILGGFVDDILVSMMFIIWKRLLVNGTRMKGCYIYGVTTDEQYRNRGYLGELMEQALSYIELKGASVIYLIPEYAKIYEGMGFTVSREYTKYPLAEEELPEGSYTVEKIKDWDSLLKCERELSFFAINSEELKECITIEKDENYFEIRFRQAEAEGAGIYVVKSIGAKTERDALEAIVVTGSDERGDIYVCDVICPYDNNAALGFARLTAETDKEIKPFIKNPSIMIYNWINKGIDIKLNDEI